MSLYHRFFFVISRPYFDVYFSIGVIVTFLLSTVFILWNYIPWLCCNHVFTQACFPAISKFFFRKWWRCFWTKKT